MCNLFSGHISYAESDFGKVYFISGIHHEEDRKHIPHEQLLAWETVNQGSFESGIRFTHCFGRDFNKEQLEQFEGIVIDWSVNQDEIELAGKNSETAYKFCKDCGTTEEERKFLVDRITESEDAYWFCRECSPTEVERKILVDRITESQHAYWFCIYCDPTKAERKILFDRLTESQHAYYVCKHFSPTEEERKILSDRIKKIIIKYHDSSST